MRKVTITLLAVMLGGTAAQAADGMIVASQLGSVLAGEESCGLHYDRSAVQQYIAAHVSANDMSFGSMLQLMVEGHKSEIQSMSPATVTAFCAQTGRVARANGFIQ